MSLQQSLLEDRDETDVGSSDVHSAPSPKEGPLRPDRKICCLFFFPGAPFGVGHEWLKLKLLFGVFILGFSLFLLLIAAAIQNPLLLFSVGGSTCGLLGIMVPTLFFAVFPKVKILPIDQEFRVTSAIFGFLCANVILCVLDGLSGFVMCIVFLAMCLLLFVDARIAWRKPELLIAAGVSDPRLFMISATCQFILAPVMLIGMALSMQFGSIFLGIPFSALFVNYVYVTNEVRAFLSQLIEASLPGAVRTEKCEVITVAAVAAVFPLYSLVAVLMTVGMLFISSISDGAYATSIISLLAAGTAMLMQFGMAEGRKPFRSALVLLTASKGPVISIQDEEESGGAKGGTSDKTDVREGESEQDIAEQKKAVEAAPSKLKALLLKIKNWALTWAGQTVISAAIYSGTMVGFIVLGAIRKDSISFGVAGLAGLGLAVCAVAVIFRFRPHIKISPTDDHNRSLILIQGGIGLLNAMSAILSAGETKSGTLLGKLMLTGQILLFIVNTVGMAIVTFHDARRFYREPKLLQVTHPKMLVVAYAWCFAWSQLAAVFIFAIFIQTAGYYPDSGLLLYGMGLGMVGVLATYRNNELKRFFLYRKMFFDRDLEDESVRLLVGQSRTPLGAASVNLYVTAVAALMCALGALVLVLTPDQPGFWFPFGFYGVTLFLPSVLVHFALARRIARPGSEHQEKEASSEDQFLQQFQQPKERKATDTGSSFYLASPQQSLTRKSMVGTRGSIVADGSATSGLLSENNNSTSIEGREDGRRSSSSVPGGGGLN